MNQYGQAARVEMTNATVYLTDGYSKKELLIVDSQNSEINLIGNKIFFNDNKNFAYLLRINAIDVSLKITELILNFKRVEILIFCDTLNIKRIFLSKLELFLFSGTLIKVDKLGVYKANFPSIILEKSIFKVNNDIHPFIDLKGFCNMTLFSINFYISFHLYHFEHYLVLLYSNYINCQSVVVLILNY